MSDEAPDAITQTQTFGASADAFTQPESRPTDVLAERPELLAGAAFVGGLVSALIVRRLGR